MTTRRRLLLWSLPLVLAAAGLTALESARAAARFNEACSLLAAGEAETAARLLAELAPSPVYGARARAGLRIAAALGSRRAGRAAAAPLDTTPFPLAVLARRAFERGQFESAVELIELADQAGRPTVPLVKSAALIERGKGAGVAPARNVSAPPPSARLARRIRTWAETAPEDDGSLILRDRGGRRLGHLDADGTLAIAAGIRPEWIPRAVAAAAAAYREAVSLRLSLDLEISELALDAFGSYRGSIVIVEARSGEILAAVSDRKSFRQGGTPALEERREPASIAKLVTTVAALRAGLDPDAEIARMTCDGHRIYNGEPLYCPYIAGPLRGLDHALAVSCNVAFADLGVEVGRRRMLEELHRWGFDEDLGRFPGGRIVEPEGDDRQLADLSIGLEATEVTPLHAALIAAVMANDGRLPVPTLLHAEDGRLGFHPRYLLPAPGRQVMEPRWLPQLLSAMEAVAERGTAGGIAPPGFPVAMKTGTASDPRWGFHVNYIGIGPMPNPRLAFAVRITHQRTSRDVRYAARRVTRRLLRALASVAEERGWLEWDETVRPYARAAVGAHGGRPQRRTQGLASPQPRAGGDVLTPASARR